MERGSHNYMHTVQYSTVQHLHIVLVVHTVLCQIRSKAPIVRFASPQTETPPLSFSSRVAGKIIDRPDTHACLVQIQVDMI